MSTRHSNGKPLEFRWQWHDAIYAEPRFNGTDKAILAFAATRLVWSGKDTFSIGQEEFAERVGECARTIRRAVSERAVPFGYLEYLGRRRGKEGDYDAYRIALPGAVAETDEYRTNLSATTGVVPDKSVQSTGLISHEYRTNLSEVPDESVRYSTGLTSENDPPKYLNKDLNKKREKVARASDASEPLDVEAVPDPGNALSPNAFLEDHNDSAVPDLIPDGPIIDAELTDDQPRLDADDDHQPPPSRSSAPSTCRTAAIAKPAADAETNAKTAKSGTRADASGDATNSAVAAAERQAAANTRHPSRSTVATTARHPNRPQQRRPHRQRATPLSPQRSWHPMTDDRTQRYAAARHHIDQHQREGR